MGDSIEQDSQSQQGGPLLPPDHLLGIRATPSPLWAHGQTFQIFLASSSLCSLLPEFPSQLYSRSPSFFPSVSHGGRGSREEVSQSGERCPCPQTSPEKLAFLGASGFPTSLYLPDPAPSPSADEEIG